MEFPYEFTAATILNQGRTSQICIDDVKSWLVQEGYPKFCDELIVLFLLACNNNLEATKFTINTYFRLKQQAPELYDDRDIERDDLRKASTTAVTISMPERFGNNDVIHWIGIQDQRYSNFELVPIMKLAYMLLDVSQRRDPPNGLVVVLDMKGIGLMHLTKLRLDPLKKFFQFLQEAMPMKLKVIHILNANYVFSKGFAIVKVFMKRHVVDMMKVHPPNMHLEKFYEEDIPRRCLPEEYGGLLPSVSELNRRTIQQFRELKPFFDAEEAFRKTM